MSKKADAWLPCASDFAAGDFWRGGARAAMQMTLVLWPLAYQQARQAAAAGDGPAIAGCVGRLCGAVAGGGAGGAATGAGARGEGGGLTGCGVRAPAAENQLKLRSGLEGGRGWR